MSIKPRTIKSLRDARERLRDIAAAKHGTAARARDLANEHLVHEEDTLDEFLDDACDTLHTITTVHDLDRMAETTAELRRAVTAAAAAQAAALAASEKSASELRERTRQLRSLEKLSEKIDHERAVVEARYEQQRSDELAASARRR